MAVSSGWWISPRRVSKPVQTTSPAATPTKATRSSDLVNSAMASAVQALEPAHRVHAVDVGQQRLLRPAQAAHHQGDEAGQQADQHQRCDHQHELQQQVAEVAEQFLRSCRRLCSGLSACFIHWRHGRSSRSWPSPPARRRRTRRRCRSRARQVAPVHGHREPLMAITASTPAPNTAAVPSSRERGRLPCSRASRRRFSVGCSVFSPADSFSDITGTAAGDAGVRARTVPLVVSRERQHCLLLLIQAFACLCAAALSHLAGGEDRSTAAVQAGS